MSATLAVVPLPTPTSSPNRAISSHHSIFPLSSGRIRNSTPISSSSFISVSHGFLCRKASRRSSPRHRPPFSPVMEWQDCTVKMDIDVSSSTAYKCYSDREAIPQWMPFISSVKILEDKPELSRWSLKYKAFGQDIEFSWLAHNMQPIPNKKIHWRSLEGLPNKY
ncbi:unnamed protein product [Cuscuta campestris]|uniref:Coenzyme Q-binding protein COQ10 START domain-containing protein n=1 Tax=Cuscuta campestris TaxID=132261 RepID=A0A484K1P9_9ASTE|nr:unnamed protein product [Cuscuta campestris]